MGQMGTAARHDAMCATATIDDEEAPATVLSSEPVAKRSFATPTELVGYV
jgi:hypothetical protein